MGRRAVCRGGAVVWREAGGEGGGEEDAVGEPG